MLKTKHNDRIWLVTQPDHAHLAGILASHWGNEQFSPLGGYSDVPESDALRAEAIFAITQHDNGWFEWEAEPRISEVDGFAADLSEMTRDQQDGMNRWRLGLRRFPDHPFANLLISEHPRLLYSNRQDNRLEPYEIHPLFWKRRQEVLLPGSSVRVESFLDELHHWSHSWKSKLGEDHQRKLWLKPETLKPHVRMLQILDGLSLGLTSSLIPSANSKNLGLGRDPYELQEVPRRSWEDRVTIKVLPWKDGHIVLDPYPFDLDPLTVSVPAKVLDSDTSGGESYLSRWSEQSPQLLKFHLGSSEKSF